MTTTDQKAGDRYLIRKRGAFYRPNAEGYTNNKAEAGRYTLAQAIWHSHPNGPNGPRDGIDYVLADEPAAPCLASVSSASAEIPVGMKTWLGGDAAPSDWNNGPVLCLDGRTEEARDITIQQWKRPVPGCKWNIIAYTPEPVPATNQAGEVEREKIADIIDALVTGPILSNIEGGKAAHRLDQLAAADRIIAALATQPATSQEGEVCSFCRGRAATTVADDSDVFPACPNCADVWAADPGFALAATPTHPTETELKEAIAAIIAPHVARYVNDHEKHRHSALWADSATMQKVERILALLPAPTPPTLSEDLRAAVAGIADDYMTSDAHHPGYVLIPTTKFEELAALARAQEQAS